MTSSPPRESATSSLIFPSSSSATPSISSTLTSVKRSTLSVPNRLSSIVQDASFIQDVASSYRRPLVANERCGSWYIPPGTVLGPEIKGDDGKQWLRKKEGSCYFKSTDGHTGNWRFNLRRLNLHVLNTVGKGDGCIIVDSTRRGKRMPDALSKTIPVWCAVLNRVLFPGADSSAGGFHSPPQSVSASEHSQIEARIDGFMQDFLTLNLDLSTVRSEISKPLRPIWVTQDSTLPHAPPDFPDFHPIILCTASRGVEGAEASEGGYIQGAGDDSEGWSHGLTSEVFWSKQKLLLSTAEQELPSLISSLISTDSTSPGNSTDTSTLIPPTSNLYLAPLSDLTACLLSRAYSHVITISPAPSLTLDAALSQAFAALHPTAESLPAHLHLALQEGKNGSRALRSHLPSMVGVLAKQHSEEKGWDGTDLRLLVAAPYPPDHGIGVVLTLLCCFYDEVGMLNGDIGTFHPVSFYAREDTGPEPTGQRPGRASQQQLPPSAATAEISKPIIQRRLARLLSAFPSSVNPSRETLKAVNTLLMSPSERG